MSLPVRGPLPAIIPAAIGAPNLAAENLRMGETVNGVHAGSAAVLPPDSPAAPSSAAQRTMRMGALVDQCNEMIARFSADRSTKPTVVEFYESLLRASRCGDDVPFAIDMQLLAAQFLNIIEWIEQGVPGANAFRLTGSEEGMIRHRGRSFLDKSRLPEGLGIASKEGEPGIFDRGWEGVKKLGDNIWWKAFVDEWVFKALKDRVVLYTMTHGWIAVPSSIIDATLAGRISTIHKTGFLADFIPGTEQAASTGAGHFQGRSLDIKYVTAGGGIQFNVMYAEGGRIARVYAQRLEAGKWTVALPGYVDYVVNCGGLRFDDFSIRLDDSETVAFGSIASAIPIYAPYLVAANEVIRGLIAAPEIVWLKEIPAGLFVGNAMELYRDLNQNDIAKVVRGVAAYLETI